MFNYATSTLRLRLYILYQSRRERKKRSKQTYDTHAHRRRCHYHPSEQCASLRLMARIDHSRPSSVHVRSLHRARGAFNCLSAACFLRVDTRPSIPGRDVTQTRVPTVGTTSVPTIAYIPLPQSTHDQHDSHISIREHCRCEIRRLCAPPSLRRRIHTARHQFKSPQFTSSNLRPCQCLR